MRKLLPATLSLLLTLTLAFPSSGIAAGESQYQSGLVAYKQKRYAEAADLFWQSITEGNSSAHAWLYMAHSYTAAGNKEKALDTYQQITQIFKGQPAEKMALAGIQKASRMPAGRTASSSASTTTTASSSNTTATASPPQPISKPKTQNPNDYRSLPLRDRVIVYKAHRKFGHPEVTPASADVVTTAIRRLPKHIYKILEDGGVTITVAPNIIDKWPDMVKNDSLDVDAQNLAQEGGRCYGRDVHVWQHSIQNGSLAVKGASNTGFILCSLYHELGHAVDDCMGSYSSSAEALKLHEQDVKEMPDNMRTKLNYYTQSGQKGCSEACAELFSQLLGAEDSDAVNCAIYFRRLQHFLRQKVRL